MTIVPETPVPEWLQRAADKISVLHPECSVTVRDSLSRPPSSPKDDGSAPPDAREGAAALLASASALSFVEIGSFMIDDVALWGKDPRRAVEQLEKIIDRIVELMDWRDEVNTAIRQVLKGAGEVGFDPRAIRSVIARRKDGFPRAREAMLKAYVAALGDPQLLTATESARVLQSSAALAVSLAAEAERLTPDQKRRARALVRSRTLNDLATETGATDALAQLAQKGAVHG